MRIERLHLFHVIGEKYQAQLEAKDKNLDIKFVLSDAETKELLGVAIDIYNRSRPAVTEIIDKPAGLAIEHKPSIVDEDIPF